MILFVLSIISFAREGTFENQERRIDVVARRFYYSPDTIVVNRGDRVILRLISEDVQHGLYIDGYDLNVTAYPGSDGRVSFVADRTGKFTFRCSVTCGMHHPYMVGYLKVLPNKYFYISLWTVLAILAALLLRISL